MNFSKKYFGIISQNFMSVNSCNLKWNKKTYLSYRLNAAGVENFRPIPSQFLHLFFWTNSIPFLARKYRSKKKVYFGNELQGDTAKIAVYIKQNQLGYILHKFMDQWMNNQLSPEGSAIKFEKNYAKFIIWNAPLDHKTHCVQTSETAYIDDIPLYLKFITKNCLLSEIAVWAFFYNLLRVRDLWARWYLNIEAYCYYDDIEI